MKKTIFNKSNGLDAKDRKILYELDFNARQSNSAIAKKVGLSKEVVGYRIKRMIDSGLIDGFYTVINMPKLGYMYCRILMRLENMDAGEQRGMIEHIKKQKNVAWLGSQEGYWNLVAVLWARNIYELEEHYEEFMFRFSRHIRDKMITIATKVHNLQYKMLYEKHEMKEAAKEVVVGGIKEDIGQADMGILRLLAKNPRIPVLDISKRLDISVNNARSRIKNLIKKGIILAFRPNLNLRLMDYHYFHIFLDLDNMTKQKKKEIIYYLACHPNVFYITEHIGGKEDLDFEVYTESYNRMNDMMKELRQRFPENIRNHEFMLISDVYEVNYMIG